MPEPRDHPLVGKTLAGRYRVEEHLGEGGVGLVFRAEHLALGRKVAIKVLHSQSVAFPSAEARFEREARALAALSHPHVVTVTDFGRSEDVTFLAMELVEGGSLRELLDREGTVSWARTIDISVQVLRALAYAHGKGVLHRDLKPGNLMVRDLPEGGTFVQILDFGMAKLVGAEEDERDPTITKPGMVAGTPSYMAPELLDAHKASPASDLYAVGVVMFEMLAGRPPFLGETPLEILQGHLTVPVPRLSDLGCTGNWVPPAQKLLERLLAKQPSARFSSAADVLDDIDAITIELEAGRLSGVGLEATQLAPVPVAPLAAPTPPAPAPAPRPRSGRGMALLVLLAVAVAGAIWVLPADTFEPWLARVGIGPERFETAMPPANAGTGPVTPPATLGDASQDPVGGGTEADSGPANPMPADTGAPDGGPAEGADAGAGAPAPADAGHAQPAGGRPEPADLLSEPMGRQLARLRRRARTARRPAHFAALYEYAQHHPEDARIQLILAHRFIRLNWRGDAITRYQQAVAADPRARGDSNMRSDLISLVKDRTHGRRASEAIVEIYGAEAREDVARAVAQTRDPDARRRLVALRSRLR